MALKTIIMMVIAIVIAVVLVPTVWDAVYDTALSNTSEDEFVNGSAKTLLKLVPLIFVGAFIVGTVMFAKSQF